jgi:hypothetical protein
MSDLELFDAVAQKTGEDSHEIRRRGFVLTGPEDSGPEPPFSVPTKPKSLAASFKAAGQP